MLAIIHYVYIVYSAQCSITHFTTCILHGVYYAITIYIIMLEIMAKWTLSSMNKGILYLLHVLK